MSTPPSNPASNRSTPAPRGRPAPRAGYTRKSKAERDLYAAEQAERDKARSATPSTTAAPTRGGRGAGRGGRGVLNRETSRPSGDGTGFGVFGGNTGAAKSRTKDNQQGQEEWLAGGPRTKEAVEAASAAQSSAQVGSKDASTGEVSTGGAAAPLKSTPVSGPQDYLVPEDDEVQVQRRDIERIWISSDEELTVDDEEDDVVATKGKRRAASPSKPKQRRSVVAGGLRPVRAPRAPLETDEYDDDNAHSKEGIRRHKREGTTAANAHVVLDDSDPMDVDQPSKDAEIQPLKSPTSSPELKKKALATGRRPAATRSKSSSGHQETQEERAERVRVIDETSKLLDVFAPQDGPASHKGKGKSTGQGRLFLVQFPPITPLLIDPTAPTGASDDEEVADEVKVKTEHGDTSTNPAGTSQQKNTTTGQKQSLQQTATAGLLTADSTTRLPRGFVGKLNVHASGKVSLDWAGTAMEVKLGTEVDFLQDAVLLQPDPSEDEDGDGAVGTGEDDEEGEDGEANGQVDGVNDGGSTVGAKKNKKSRPEKGAAKGTAYALGQVEGKLVATPAWGRIFD